MKVLHALAYTAKEHYDDNRCYHEAMNSPDTDGFHTALELALTQIQKKKHGKFSIEITNLIFFVQPGYSKSRN